jgi:phosphoglycolate phosphatase
MKNGKAIIWDWNGTLLDDVQICINGINGLLSDRHLPLLDENRYRDIFTFPVKEYYEKAGFDFTAEPFDIPAMQFIDYYRAHLPAAELFPDAVEVLEYFRQKGFMQSVLSAMENDFLHMSIKEKSIYDYFEHIAGIHNHFAESKIMQARQLIELMRVKPEDTVIIGDTQHDYEVSNAVGCRILLVARGHQSPEKLKKLECNIVSNLSEVKSILK